MPLVPVAADLVSPLASELTSLSSRIVFTCVADWLSRTRLLQTSPHDDAFTLCFLFFHGLTMQRQTLNAERFAVPARQSAPLFEVPIRISDYSLFPPASHNP